jgi:hypothetical protein
MRRRRDSEGALIQLLPGHRVAHVQNLHTVEIEV